MRVANYIIARLVSVGVRHIFGVPGGAIGPICDALIDYPEIEPVHLHHEGCCGLAAQAQAALTGLGVCMVTAGPGVTNCLSALASAYVNSSPVLFISGQVRKAHIKGKDGGRQYLRQSGLQEVDTLRLVASMVKYSAEVTDRNSVRDVIDSALYEMKSKRPGPAWISIPLDVQSETVEEDMSYMAWKQKLLSPFVGDNEAGDVLYGLRESNRPLVLLGGGVRMAGAAELAVPMVERLGIPCQTTWTAADLIPDNHPLFAGRPGLFGSRHANFSIVKCDALLAIGVRMDLATTAFSTTAFCPNGPRYIVDVDTAELHRHQEDNDVPIFADAKAFMQSVLDQPEPEFPVDRSGWIDRIAAWKSKYPVPAIPPTEGKLSFYTFVDVLSDCLQEGDIIVSGSAGNYSEILMQAIKAKRGQRIIADWNLGQMGFGIPAAIGAAKASGKRVVLAEGDGSLMPNLQELETIGRLGLPICIFVLNNGGYASIRQSQQAWFGRTMPNIFSSGIDSMDEFCRCLGLAYQWSDGSVQADISTSPRMSLDFKQQIQEVLASTRPILCEIEVDPDEQRSPRVASRRAADGSMVTDPLEDMTPKLSREEFAEEMK